MSKRAMRMSLHLMFVALGNKTDILIKEKKNIHLQKERKKHTHEGKQKTINLANTMIQLVKDVHMHKAVIFIALSVLF